MEGYSVDDHHEYNLNSYKKIVAFYVSKVELLSYDKQDGAYQLLGRK